MTNIKTYHVEATQVKGFLTEVKAGNHVVRLDQPEPLSRDEGITPLHNLLAALCGCVVGMAVIVAHRRQIQIRNISVTADGTVDLDAIRGDSNAGRVGYCQIDFSVNLDSDLSQEEKRAFLDEVHRLCPVADTIEQGTPVNWQSV